MINDLIMADFGEERGPKVIELKNQIETVVSNDGQNIREIIGDISISVGLVRQRIYDEKPVMEVLEAYDTYDASIDNIQIIDDFVLEMNRLRTDNIIAGGKQTIEVSQFLDKIIDGYNIYRMPLDDFLTNSKRTTYDLSEEILLYLIEKNGIVYDIDPIFKNNRKIIEGADVLFDTATILREKAFESRDLEEIEGYRDQVVSLKEDYEKLEKFLDKKLDIEDILFKNVLNEVNLNCLSFVTHFKIKTKYITHEIEKHYDAVKMGQIQSSVNDTIWTYNQIVGKISDATSELILPTYSRIEEINEAMNTVIYNIKAFEKQLDKKYYDAAKQSTETIADLLDETKIAYSKIEQGDNEAIKLLVHKKEIQAALDHNKYQSPLVLALNFVRGLQGFYDDASNRLNTMKDQLDGMK